MFSRNMLWLVLRARMGNVAMRGCCGHRAVDREVCQDNVLWLPTIRYTIDLRSRVGIYRAVVRISHIIIYKESRIFL